MAYDNICKYLAEQYPAEFVSWLLQEETTDIQILATELRKLGEALLDFETLTDLAVWLDECQSEEGSDHSSLPSD